MLVFMVVDFGNERLANGPLGTPTGGQGPGGVLGLVGTGRMGVGGGPDQALHVGVEADIVGDLGEGGAGIGVRSPFAGVPHGDDILSQIVVAGVWKSWCATSALVWSSLPAPSRKTCSTWAKESWMRARCFGW